MNQPSWIVQRDPREYARWMRISRSIGPVRDPQVVYAIMGEYASTFDEEHVWMLPLDVHGYLRDEPRQISQGGAARVELDIFQFLRASMAAGSAFPVMAHNHPTGSAWPSQSDARLTHEVAQQGWAMGIVLIDHVVLGLGEYYSFRLRQLWSRNGTTRHRKAA